MPKPRFLPLALLACLLGASSLQADLVIKHGFDEYLDYSSLTGEYAGFTYSNALVLTSSISLNEFDFPPRSGANVVVDDGAPLTVLFPELFHRFDGYFTYGAPLTLSFFDDNAQLVGQVSSAFGNNIGTAGEAGSAPNELLSYAHGSGFRSMSISGGPNGYSFAGDDFTFTQAAPTVIPEPEHWALLAAAVAAVCLRRRTS